MPVYYEYPSNVEKRAMQQEVVTKSLKENTFVRIPMGLGTSVISAILIKIFWNAYRNAGHVIFLASDEKRVRRVHWYGVEVLGIAGEEITMLTDNDEGQCEGSTIATRNIVMSTPAAFLRMLERNGLEMGHVRLMIVADVWRDDTTEHCEKIANDIYSRTTKCRTVVFSTVMRLEEKGLEAYERLFSSLNTSCLVLMENRKEAHEGNRIEAAPEIVACSREEQNAKETLESTLSRHLDKLTALRAKPANWSVKKLCAKWVDDQLEKQREWSERVEQRLQNDSEKRERVRTTNAAIGCRLRALGTICRARAQLRAGDERGMMREFHDVTADWPDASDKKLSQMLKSVADELGVPPPPLCGVLDVNRPAENVSRACSEGKICKLLERMKAALLGENNRAGATATENTRQAIVFVKEGETAKKVTSTLSKHVRTALYDGTIANARSIAEFSTGTAKVLVALAADNWEQLGVHGVELAVLYDTTEDLAIATENDGDASSAEHELANVLSRLNELARLRAKTCVILAWNGAECEVARAAIKDSECWLTVDEIGKEQLTLLLTPRNKVQDICFEHDELRPYHAQLGVQLGKGATARSHERAEETAEELGIASWSQLDHEQQQHQDRQNLSALRRAIGHGSPAETPKDAVSRGTTEQEQRLSMGISCEQGAEEQMADMLRPLSISQTDSHAGPRLSINSSGTSCVGSIFEEPLEKISLDKVWREAGEAAEFRRFKESERKAMNEMYKKRSENPVIDLTTESAEEIYNSIEIMDEDPAVRDEAV